MSSAISEDGSQVSEESKTSAQEEAKEGVKEEVKTETVPFLVERMRNYLSKPSQNQIYSGPRKLIVSAVPRGICLVELRGFFKQYESFELCKVSQAQGYLFSKNVGKILRPVILAKIAASDEQQQANDFIDDFVLEDLDSQEGGTVFVRLIDYLSATIQYKLSCDRQQTIPDYRELKRIASGFKNTNLAILRSRMITSLDNIIFRPNVYFPATPYDQVVVEVVIERYATNQFGRMSGQITGKSKRVRLVGVVFWNDRQNSIPLQSLDECDFLQTCVIIAYSLENQRWESEMSDTLRVVLLNSKINLSSAPPILSEPSSSYEVCLSFVSIYGAHFSERSLLVGDNCLIFATDGPYVKIVVSSQSYAGQPSSAALASARYLATVGARALHNKGVPTGFGTPPNLPLNMDDAYIACLTPYPERKNIVERARQLSMQLGKANDKKPDLSSSSQLLITPFCFSNSRDELIRASDAILITIARHVNEHGFIPMLRLKDKTVSEVKELMKQMLPSTLEPQDARSIYAFVFSRVASFLQLASLRSAGCPPVIYSLDGRTTI